MRVPLAESDQGRSSFILRSLLRKMEGDEEDINSQPPWAFKWQLPGKHYAEDPQSSSIQESEQWKNSGQQEKEIGACFTNLQKRQHPGEREAERTSYVVLKGQHHQGKNLVLKELTHNNSPTVHSSDVSAHLENLFLVRTKASGDELDSGDQQHLGKRQHPGK
ncbi:pro-thyrotropin-releasing hormone-A-like [Megalops cyprinoides]|uniref:pro-thyrotropin-releasing hormone-A-like n=1 Tax=Megalops cyprinoides TaxID=118141 RepID=UPI001864F5A6|nr:pro-thyrotropin-releasing hormone-A-like [Megalops cyprinoides]